MARAREFTPSIERLRDEYVRMRSEHYGFTDLYAAEFDRTLAAHDREVAARALREAGDELFERTDEQWHGGTRSAVGAKRWGQWLRDRAAALTPGADS